MNKGSRYCLQLFAWTGLCMGLLAGFNAAIDPYQLLESTKVEGLNARKTRIFLQLVTTKPYQFYNSNATGLILGSSRAGRAIDARNPSLGDQHFYNFAIPGSYPGLDYLKLRAALATHDINRVIYFVDFFTFNHSYVVPASVTEAFEKRMSLNGSVWTSPGFVRQALLDYGAAFWAYYTLRDSISTIRDQDAAKSGRLSYNRLNDDGSWTMVFAADRKPAEAFVRMEDTYVAGTWFSQTAPRFSLSGSGAAGNPSFSDFKALLTLAQDHGIDLTVAILPVHARLLENLDYAGLWPSFEYWKRELVNINEQVARSSHRAPFVIWDFNGYFPAITENISDDVHAAPPKWFYDSAHTQLRTGNRILDIIAGRTEADFGGTINLANIDDWLQHLRDLRDAYRRANPGVTRNIKRRVERLRKRQHWEISPLAPPAH